MYTVKKRLATFPFPARESLVSDILPVDGENDNLLLQCKRPFVFKARFEKPSRTVNFFHISLRFLKPHVKEIAN
jgi:hypothetical protein